MLYPRTSFILLATTLVTAVLAAPKDVRIRRGSSTFVKLSDAFSQTNSAIQTVDENIQKLSPTADESEARASIDSFSAATIKVEGMGFFVGLLNETLDEKDSKRLVDDSVMSLFNSLNKTAHSLARQKKLTTGLSLFDFATFAASIESMVFSIDILEVAIQKTFAPNTVTHLDGFVASLNTTYANIIVDSPLSQKF